MTAEPTARLRPPDLERGVARPPAPRRALRLLMLLCAAAGALLLRLAAQPRPHRQPRAVRAADRRRAVQPDPGARLLVDLRERALAPAAGAGERAPRSSTCSSRSTTSRSTSSSRRSPPPPAARRAVRVWLLDDGNRDEMRELAARHGAGYMRRRHHTGAKAGNINHALRRTDAAVHRRPRLRPRAGPAVPRGDARPHGGARVAFVQTPQYYANAEQRASSPAAAWSQQALFFGAIARGKDGHDSMFCCGTNVVFRRDGVRERRRLPEDSLTEDFELSICLHERGWSALRAGGARARPRPRGHGRLRLPAAPLGARLPGRIRARAARAPAAAACRPSTCCRLVLPVRLDGAGLHELPGDPDAHGRPADRGTRARPVPAALRALLRPGADHGGAGGLGRVHVPRLRAAVGDVLDPRARHALALLRRPGSSR